MTFYEGNLDFNFAFSKYAQALNKQKESNPNVLRALYYQCLHLSTTKQSRCKVLHLPAIKVII